MNTSELKELLETHKGLKEVGIYFVSTKVDTIVELGERILNLEQEIEYLKKQNNDLAKGYY